MPESLMRSTQAFEQLGGCSVRTGCAKHALNPPVDKEEPTGNRSSCQIAAEEEVSEADAPQFVLRAGSRTEGGEPTAST